MTALTWEWIDSAFAYEGRDADGKPVGIWIFSRIVDHGRSRESFYDVAASWGPYQRDIVHWAEAFAVAEAMYAASEKAPGGSAGLGGNAIWTSSASPPSGPCGPLGNSARQRPARNSCSTI